MLFSSQHLCYYMQSQRKLYPSIATSIMWYHLATCDTTKKFHREQIMSQDAEHLIDTCGIQTPQQLQEK